MVELCTYVHTSYIRQTFAQFKQMLVDKEGSDFCRKKFRYDSDIPSTPTRNKNYDDISSYKIAHFLGAPSTSV